jgi:hypothetical protein
VKHPPEYQRDLNPDHMAVQNLGTTSDREVAMRSAFDIKPLSRALDLPDDELKRVPVIRPGARLQQHATDLIPARRAARRVHRDGRHGDRLQKRLRWQGAGGERHLEPPRGIDDPQRT